MSVPSDLRFLKSHEWLRLEGDTATIGISDHAQRELTDIVYVELPEVGKTVNAGEPVCVVESVKTASDIYAPVSGTVSEVNSSLTSQPELVNSDPYDAGWIYKIATTPGTESPDLINATDYSAQIGES